MSLRILYTTFWRNYRTQWMWNGSGLATLGYVLKEGAQDCGRAATIHAIFDTLRVRCEMSVQRGLLGVRDAEKIVVAHFSRAYCGNVEDNWNHLCRSSPGVPKQDDFRDILPYSGNGYFQCHLLAVGTTSAEEAMRAINELLQIKYSFNKIRTTVRQLGNKEE